MIMLIPYVKRMLQHILPQELRSSIAADLFDEFVDCVRDFSKELYMNIDEVRKLVKRECTLANHGSMHYWLNRISPEEQEKDIKQSLNFLRMSAQLSKIDNVLFVRSL